MNKMITIVSGLPRSGTSMMMRMLEAGGIELIADNIRKADEDNPHGYFEFEKVKKIKDDSSWLDAAGAGCLKWFPCCFMIFLLTRIIKLYL